MKQFILNLSFLTTKEFCEKYDLKLPSNSNKKTKEELAFEFITLDAIKYKMIVEEVKIIKSNVDLDYIQKVLRFSKFYNPKIKINKNNNPKTLNYIFKNFTIEIRIISDSISFSVQKETFINIVNVPLPLKYNSYLSETIKYIFTNIYLKYC